MELMPSSTKQASQYLRMDSPLILRTFFIRILILTPCSYGLTDEIHLIGFNHIIAFVPQKSNQTDIRNASWLQVNINPENFHK